MKYILEVGARTVDDVIAAECGGADRVELYSSPMEGALTPSAGLIREAARAAKILKLLVMIRPRNGGFVYSANEFVTMQRDVEIAMEMGAHGVMCGILTEDGALDVRRMGDLRRRCEHGMFVLHRAFDFSSDPFATLDAAIDVGCEVVLTLGQEDGATFDAAARAAIMAKAEGKIRIMLGLGADFNTAADLEPLIRRTGAREYHIVNGYRKRTLTHAVAPVKGAGDDHLRKTMLDVEYLSQNAVRECRDILDNHQHQPGKD